MEAREFIELFDSYWFEMEIFKKQPSSSKSSSFEAIAHHQNEEKAPKSEILRVPTMITRTTSDQLCSKTSFNSDCSLSPDSVLHITKLHTVLSGKEITGEEENSIETPIQHVPQESHRKKVTSRTRAKKTMSKSLSELEFEELKGFMDLGFVFSEEDKDSRLVSIIPGLQRLGKKDGEKQETVINESGVSRPYLSEAWEVLDRRKKEHPLMNWRIPALNNEIDMKDNLKWWAHTVASTVR